MPQIDSVKFVTFKAGDVIEVLEDEPLRPMRANWQPFDKGTYLVQGFTESYIAMNFRGKPEEFCCVLRKHYGKGRLYKYVHHRDVGSLSRMEQNGTVRRLVANLFENGVNQP